MPSFKPHDYQRTAIGCLLCHLMIEEETGFSLQLDPGLGKTAICLEALRTMFRLKKIERVLIIAPLRVCYNVWPQEVKRWGYSYDVINVHERSNRLKALDEPADIYLLNRDLVPWLAKQDPKYHRFDLLINDESTSFKNWSAQRSKALRKILKHIRHRINLTGTPAPNGEIDWFSQQWIADNGVALGRNITYFRGWACEPDPNSFFGRGWRISEQAKPEFYRRIAPSVLVMKCEDYLDMPAKVDNFLRVDLPPEIRRAYDGIEAELFAELESGQQLTASSAGAKYNLCRQVANGGAYQDDGLGNREAIHVHNAKVDAVRELFDELNGKPLMVAYQFQHDKDRLLKAFPFASAIAGGMSGKETTRICERWNAGKVPMLLVQPQALSHGINLQAGGRDLAWFGHTDQLECYLQLNARLWRQGQTGTVRFHHIVANQTVDEAVWTRLMDKDSAQTALVKALTKYRKSRLQPHS